MPTPIVHPPPPAAALSWLGTGAVASASTSVVAGGALAFYLIEHCSRVDCPFSSNAGAVGEAGAFFAYKDGWVDTEALLGALHRFYQVCLGASFIGVSGQCFDV